MWYHAVLNSVLYFAIISRAAPSSLWSVASQSALFFLCCCIEWRIFMHVTFSPCSPSPLIIADHHSNLITHHTPHAHDTHRPRRGRRNRRRPVIVIVINVVISSFWSSCYNDASFLPRSLHNTHPHRQQQECQGAIAVGKMWNICKKRGLTVILEVKLSVLRPERRQVPHHSCPKPLCHHPNHYHRLHMSSPCSKWSVTIILSVCDLILPSSSRSITSLSSLPACIILVKAVGRSLYWIHRHPHLSRLAVQHSQLHWQACILLFHLVSFCSPPLEDVIWTYTYVYIYIYT